MWLDRYMGDILCTMLGCAVIGRAGVCETLWWALVWSAQLWWAVTECGVVFVGCSRVCWSMMRCDKVRWGLMECAAVWCGEIWCGEVRCGEVRWGGVQAVRALFFSFTFSARLLQCGNQTEVIFFKGKPILFSKRLFFLQYTNFLFFGYGSEGNWDEEKTVKMKKNYVHQSHYSVRYFWSDFIWIYLPKYSN